MSSSVTNGSNAGRARFDDNVNDNMRAGAKKAQGPNKREQEKSSRRSRASEEQTAPSTGNPKAKVEDDSDEIHELNLRVRAYSDHCAYLTDENFALRRKVQAQADDLLIWRNDKRELPGLVDAHRRQAWQQGREELMKFLLRKKRFLWLVPGLSWLAGGKAPGVEEEEHAEGDAEPLSQERGSVSE